MTHLRAMIFVSIALLGSAIHAHAQQSDENSPFSPRPSRVVPGTAPGYAALTPNRSVVASVGDYELRFVVGEGGIAEGGTVLVDFPKAWFSNPVPLIKPVQLNDPAAPHYMGVTCSRAGADLDVHINRRNLDGSIERFRHVVNVTLKSGSLMPGDEIVVRFANTTSPIVSGADAVRVAVDTRGDGRFKLIENGAAYNIVAGPAAYAMLIAPSQAVVGESIDLQLTVFDALDNIAEGHEGLFEIHGLADRDIFLYLTAASKGVNRFQWVPEEEGYYWPEADGELQANGGPIRVFTAEPATKIYWGDLHNHTRISKDGIGYGEYGYARDATGLDFFASTEHGGDDSYVERDGPGDSISQAEWDSIIGDVRNYYEPGRFVTLLAYECSLPGGHHNVFFRGLEGAPWPAYRVGLVETLWEKIEAGQAITVPHHLGVQWGGNDVVVTEPELRPVLTGTRFGGGPRLDWSRPHNPTLRPVLEMYSAHGQSEYFDRDDPLAYEQVRYTSGRSADGPHYARDAWAAGHAMGVIAASDDHNAHPGLNHQGITAVRAPELTRGAVFDALAQRDTYGTTGQRFIVEFTVGGVPMGREGKASGQVQGTVTVAAPDSMKFVEVMAYEEGADEWTTAARWDLPGRLLESTFVVDLKAPTTFYLRAELLEETGGRIARAWSSPVWITSD